jgi:putative cell wall-binding protein
MKIKPDKAYIIGGTGAVSEAVSNKIAVSAALDSNSIVRIGGTNRYETSLKTKRSKAKMI